MSLPRFLARAFPGYGIVELKEFLTEGRIEVWLEGQATEAPRCFRCGTPLQARRGKHRLKLEGMPVMGLKLYVHLWRRKGRCPKCGKARSEAIEFVARETPHLTQEYAWWIGRICEIAPVSRVAELVGQNGLTTWRLDYARMRRMLQHYRIPEARRISVDEVYARKKPRYQGESRNRRFFTVITDLDTHRVVWVAEGRDKESLDEYFRIIGERACSRIRVVAMDQHDAYKASAQEHCSGAAVVWDRFHIMQGFEEAVNEQRKHLHGRMHKGSEVQRLTRGRFRYVFLKKASRRSTKEQQHIDDVLKLNDKFAKLELVKERMLTFFEQPNLRAARKVFNQIGDWAMQAGLSHIVRWHNRLEDGWETLKTYFKHRVTSALSEGTNNVIKMLKRRAFGYRNMSYFKLKIMQVCGYLNSRFIPTVDSLTCT